MPIVFAKPILPTSWDSEVSADSPLFWAKLNETSGTAAANDGSGGATGVYGNSPTLGVPPLINANTAVTFNGSTQYVDYTPAVSNEFWHQNFTMEAWVKPDVLGGRIFHAGHNGDGTGQGFQWFVDSNGDIGYSTNVASVWHNVRTTTAPLSVGVTHHVGFKFSANNWVRFYVDGAFVEELPWSWSTEQTKSWPTTIGASYQGTYVTFFDGTIDEVVMFDSLIDDARITAHYNAGV